MDIEKLAEQLVVDEGLRLKPYRCTAGKLTIGVGRNLDARGITKAEAMMMLRTDIDEVVSGLFVALPWLAAAPEPIQQVLANMAFNLGMAGLLQFRQTLGFFKAGEYRKAAEAMLDSRWAVQVGARAERLAAIVRETKGA